MVQWKRICLPMQEMQETQVQSPSLEDPLEQEVAIHSTILAWKIPWTEEPGRLQSIGSQRVGPDWATEHTHTHTHTRARAIKQREGPGVMDMFCWCDLQQNREFIDLTLTASSWFNRKIPDYNGKSSTCRFMVLLLFSFFFFLIFWRQLGGVWDFSSLTRGWTLTPFSGSTEPWSLDNQGSPQVQFYAEALGVIDRSSA